MDFPADLKYTKDHEWLAGTGAKATVGVTAYAVDQLGDIVHVELPEVGKVFAAGAAFGTIESTKTVSDLYMPVAAKVVEVNKAALDSPELVQNEPYQGGWLVKIEITDRSGETSLLDARSYQAFISDNAD